MGEGIVIGFEVGASAWVRTNFANAGAQWLVLGFVRLESVS
jgi:hypothetical protein